MRNPLTLIRNAALAVCLLVVLVFAADWALAVRSLGSIQLVGTFSPSTIPADGKSTSVLRVRASQDGHPRTGDLLELLVLDNGFLVPLRAFTDGHGEARFSFTSYLASAYDPVTDPRILIRDVSIGRLVEVSKVITVKIHMAQPRTP